ncbi:hypothetical protein [Lunatibacter salilacus]|uniref:hypothetical protein n=1 Tax=Lunatibacter salilacus TaxID=2483804 RepID=UPI00131A6CE1|nr:hypothetical protein [Lunatibacter salilacus]
MKIKKSIIVFQVTSTPIDITIYLKLDEPENALPYLWEGYSLHLSIQEPLGLAISYNNLSDYNIRKKTFPLARAYLGFKQST